MMTHRHPSETFPNWAPASAGVVPGLGWRGAYSATSLRALFPRAGGSTVWVPAFAGNQRGALAPPAAC